MFLASAEDIRTQLGFDDMADINSAIVMALNAATPQLEALLDTNFGRKQVVDTFWVVAPGFVEGDHHETEFRLSCGLVDAHPIVSAAPQLTALSELDTQDYTGALQFNLEKGTAIDYTNLYDKQYVRISYTAGFEADPQDERSYDLEQVPVWLQEAAKLKVLIHMAGAPSLKEAGISLDVETMQTQLDALMAKHVRYAPMALLPMA